MHESDQRPFPQYALLLQAKNIVCRCSCQSIPTRAVQRPKFLKCPLIESHAESGKCCRIAIFNVVLDFKWRQPLQCGALIQFCRSDDLLSQQMGRAVDCDLQPTLTAFLCELCHVFKQNRSAFSTPIPSVQPSAAAMALARCAAARPRSSRSKTFLRSRMLTGVTSTSSSSLMNSMQSSSDICRTGGRRDVS